MFICSISNSFPSPLFWQSLLQLFVYILPPESIKHLIYLKGFDWWWYKYPICLWRKSMQPNLGKFLMKFFLYLSSGFLLPNVNLTCWNIRRTVFQYCKKTYCEHRKIKFANRCSSQVEILVIPPLFFKKNYLSWY